MKKFGMFVYCRRGGVSQDSGLQAQCEAENKEEALLKLDAGKELRWLYKFYDEVSYKILEIDE